MSFSASLLAKSRILLHPEPLSVIETVNPAIADSPSSSLRDLAAFALERAKAQGATAADVEISTSVGQSVTVRLGEVETIEHNRDKGLGVTVYLGQQRGNASTTDLSRAAIERTVAAAPTIPKSPTSHHFSSLP